MQVLKNLEITDLAWSRTGRGLLLAGWDPETAAGSLATVLPAVTPRLMANWTAPSSRSPILQTGSGPAFLEGRTNDRSYLAGNPRILDVATSVLTCPPPLGVGRCPSLEGTRHPMGREMVHNTSCLTWITTGGYQARQRGLSTR